MPNTGATDDRDDPPRPESDFETIYAIVNEAAMAYKGVIPADRWHEPYMPGEELRKHQGRPEHEARRSHRYGADIPWRPSARLSMKFASVTLDLHSSGIPP